jgi:hypothetical protein
LVIPKQQKNPSRLKDFEENALKNWIDELPTANVGLATRLVHDFIIELNTIEMPGQLRLNALETLRSSVLDIEDYLRSRLMQTGFPKEDNDQKILKVLVSIEQEFSIGYWIVLKELTSRTVGWFQGKTTVLSLQRCIKGLSSIIISHFIMGLPIPDWVWFDLHSLYKLSVKLKKDTTKVPNDISQNHKSSSPEDCYKQIMLLNLAEPTGLMQKEILMVYRFIELIAHLVGLKIEAVDDQTLHCIIMTDEDKPPKYSHKVDVSTDSALLFMDFTRLLKALELKEQYINADETRFGSVQVIKSSNQLLPVELIEYLEQRWSGFNLQGVPLFTDRLDRYIAVGLAAAFNLQNLASADEKKELEFLVQSESDRLLSCVFPQTGVLSVGSLVCFRRADIVEQTRLLGVVDEVVVTRQKGKIIFGLQLLANYYDSVVYKSIHAPAGESAKRGLFYNEIDLDDTEYIITDTLVLKEGDIIRLQVNNESITVTLKNRKNVGLGYWQFECQRKNEKKNNNPAKKGYDFI